MRSPPQTRPDDSDVSDTPTAAVPGERRQARVGPRAGLPKGTRLHPDATWPGRRPTSGAARPTGPLARGAPATGPGGPGPPAHEAYDSEAESVTVASLR